jgi:hypothetical protein
MADAQRKGMKSVKRKKNVKSVFVRFDEKGNGRCERRAVVNGSSKDISTESKRDIRLGKRKEEKRKIEATKVFRLKKPYTVRKRDRKKGD